MPEIYTGGGSGGGGGGGTGGGTGTETDPIAGPALSAHKSAADPHGDRVHADTADAAHAAAADPHGDRAHGDTALGAHTAAADPHGARAHADTADTAHVAAADPHGDRAHGDTALAAHEAAAPAHPASAVSFSSSGLAVVTGADVDAALRSLDAWTQTRKFSTLGDVNVAGIADGQYPAWNAAAQKYLPATPSGTSEVGYSENGTGAAVTVAGTNGNFAAGGAVAIPNTDITVDPTTRPVYLDGFAYGQQTVLGTGDAVIEVWETTGAAAFLSRSKPVVMPNSTNGSLAGRFGVYHDPIRIGPVAARRTFQLRINMWGITGPPSWQAMNTNALGFKAWLRAVAL